MASVGVVLLLSCVRPGGVPTVGEPREGRVVGEGAVPAAAGQTTTQPRSGRPWLCCVAGCGTTAPRLIVGAIKTLPRLRLTLDRTQQRAARRRLLAWLGQLEKRHSSRVVWRPGR